MARYDVNAIKQPGVLKLELLREYSDLLRQEEPHSAEYQMP